jgi:flagellar motor switch protein FliM
MEKVLSQEEIDAMVRAARSGGRAEAPRTVQPKVERWDLRRAGQIGREQLQAITLLHEGFARNLTHSLSAYLRVALATALVSAEYLAYREFLQRIPEITYLASCRLDPMEVSAALQLDLKVAFPILDLLLGGEGTSMAATRQITEIEEQILDSVARIVCRELGAAWQALSLAVVFEQRLEPGAARRLMSPYEKTLAVSFEITMPEARGGLNLALPATVTNALLRQISAHGRPRRPRLAGDCRQRLMSRLLDCPFQLELGTTDARVAVSALSALAPGRVIPFARNASEPASLLIAGRERFRALPARRGDVRVAKVLQRMAEPAECALQLKEKWR